MGSAGIAIGPDGKPLKRQERRSNLTRGFPRHGNRRGMGGMAGRPMHGGPGPMVNPGFGRPGPFMEPYMPGGPFGPGGRGPMPFGGPGRNMGFGEGNQNVSFFNPQSMPGPMGDARTGPMQSGQAATPSPSTVGKGSVGGGSSGMNTSEVNNGVATNNASEVPGFGTNSSIHELFGKMVWKKMEGLRDEAVIDRLQNRIMNMIHEALAQQSDAPAGGTGQGGTVNGRPANSFASF